MVLVIMIATGIILLGFSFWLLKRRTAIPLPSAADNFQTSNQPTPVWADFTNLDYGVTLKYPQNIFITTQTKITTLGVVTQVFEGTSPTGTITVSVVNRQIDPSNILDPSVGQINNSSTISIANQIGYQYTTIAGGCDQKNVQVPNVDQIVLVSFISCPGDTQPNLLSNQDLIQQILVSIKLTPITATSNNTTTDKNIPANLKPDQGTSLDTLPPASSKPVIKSFTIIADDSVATPASISVKAGTIVELTFNVSASNVYYGGLDFKAPLIDTGTIYAGSSKTISFKADQSFEFTPYWPSSGVKKDYTIKVNVQ